MSFYNGILNHKDEDYQFLRAARGLPGIKGDKGNKGDAGNGYKLTSDGNYDIQSKNLTNVKNGVKSSDAVTKSQLDAQTSLLQGARPGYVVNDKAVVYSQSGAVHAQSLYLKDNPDNAGNSDEIRILTEHQSYENIHLYVPNLENYDGQGGRRRSEMMVTSVDQTITGRKLFRNYITAPHPINSDHVCTKGYTDDEISKISNVDSTQFVKKTGDTMGGDLILQPQPYPIQGNTHKAISYNTTRAIFLSRKEGGAMETDLDVNNNFIVNVKDPVNIDHGVNKKYVDDGLNTKLDKIILKDVNLNNKQLKNLGFDINDQGDVVNLGFTDQKYLQKVSDSNLDLDSHRVINSLDSVNSRHNNNFTTTTFYLTLIHKKRKFTKNRN